ncbi:MAG: peptidase S41 [Alphaproteobacteria bacterium]|nr:peptidase S41 [Alphaproteobacteria bacterium]
MTSRGRASVLAVILALPLLAAPSLTGAQPADTTPAQPPAAPAAAPTPDNTAATVFDEVWRTVNEHFYDATFGGHDWAAIGDRYRPLVASAPTLAARKDAINRMLGELGASHTGYLTREDPAYYDIADIFSGALRRELPKFFPDGEVAYDGIGVFTEPVDGKIFVSGLLADLPGATAGLRTGDEIVAADGAAFDPIASFAGKADKTVTLAIRREAGGPTQDIAVTPRRIRPNEAFLNAIKASARIIEQGPRKIGYIHIWSYGRWEDERAFEEAISTGPLKDADALVWDLRDGWGGTAEPSYLNIFNLRGPVMTTTNHAGESHIVNVKWRKPVVLLINGGTRSAKEILAYGFKKYGYGPVVGTRTKGDVLAARAYMLSDGSILELAIDDVRVDGERIEGVGVGPTVEVPFTLQYSAGADPQLERAVEIAAQTPNG